MLFYMLLCIFFTGKIQIEKQIEDLVRNGTCLIDVIH